MPGMRPVGGHSESAFGSYRALGAGRPTCDSTGRPGEVYRVWAFWQSKIRGMLGFVVDRRSGGAWLAPGTAAGCQPRAQVQEDLAHPARLLLPPYAQLCNESGLLEVVIVREGFCDTVLRHQLERDTVDQAVLLVGVTLVPGEATIERGA